MYDGIEPVKAFPPKTRLVKFGKFAKTEGIVPWRLWFANSSAVIVQGAEE